MVSSTPAQKFVCPRCRTGFTEASHFCRECGADMTHASALTAASMSLDDTSASGPSGPNVERPGADRRLSDSNQQWLGKIVDGRYRVLEVIGRGGMGVVYRVEHLRMGKVAAMKVLHRDLANDAEVVQRFEREAAAISQLHHPHTVQVFDFGNATGALYLIMEYVRGLDLARVVERDGPLPWSRAAPILAQICGALQEAHELGIVHRDLKPENVLVTRTGHGRDYAKVLDFGLAKLDQRGVPTTNTDRQAIVGTPYFMAPEQIRGDNVDARTDIYSFGALMFEVLTGQHLYSGSSAVGVLTKHLTAEPDAPSMRTPKLGIPPQVDFLCRKALSRDPSERWQTAAELGEAIEEIYQETVADLTGPGARSSSRVPGATRGPLVFQDADDGSDLRLRRSDIDQFERGLRRRRYYVMGATFLVLGAAGGGAWFLATREPPPAHEEHEPNDDNASANVIAIGPPITGTIGKRRSATEADRDVYLAKFSAERHVITVTVTGIPNMDLDLAVADKDGKGVTVDEADVGEGEAIHRRAIVGPVVISVAQTMGRDQKYPIENVSDPYTLTVTEEPVAGGEIEPNNTEADATTVELGTEVHGFLDSRGDVDLLQFTGPAGTYNIVVRAEGLPLQRRLGDGKGRTPGATKLDLQHGEVIRLERVDHATKGPLVGRDRPWSIVITR